MVEGSLAVLIMAAVYLGLAAWLEQHTRPRDEDDAQGWQ